MTKFSDKTLTCQECGSEFTWDASEQAYFAKKGFKEVPKRCRACREQRKREQESEKAKEREVVCIKCGKKGLTTNEVQPDEEVLCLDCVMKEREQQNKEL